MPKVGVSGKQLSKRRPKINQIQKKLLVQLIENYFIRTTGRSTNVAFEAITSNAWDRFREILNSWGPEKSSDEWRTCFYFMKNRIRKSVELIQQCDSMVKDNLSDLDYKIYSMAPSSGVVALEELLNDDGHHRDYTADQEEQNADNIVDYVLEDGNDIRQQDDGAGNDHDFVGGSDDNLNEVRDGGLAPRVLVVQSREELEAYESTSMIVDEEGSIYHETGKVIYTSTSPGTEDNHSSSSDLNIRVIATEGEDESSQQHNVPRKPPSNPRIPEIQKERLVQLIQNNFTKAFGRFTGADGAHIKAKLWQTIATELNTLGPQRTAEQWKTTFNAIKTSAKSKLADNRSNDGSIGKPLTRLEEKILSIYGLDALDGNQQLGEAGFQYRPTVPVARKACTSTVTSGAPLSSNDKNRRPYDEQYSLSDIDQGDDDEPIQNHDMSWTEIHEDNVTRNIEENERNDVELLRRNDSEYEVSVLDDILREIREERSDTTLTMEPLPSSRMNLSALLRTTEAKNRSQEFGGDGVVLGSGLNAVRDNSSAGRRTSTSAAGQRTSISGARQRTSTSNAGQRTSTSNAGQRTSTLNAGQRTSTSSVGQRTSTSATGQRTSGSNCDNSTNRIRVSSNTLSSNQNRARGSSNGVHGVPRLRQRRISSERISDITNIQQFFADNGEEEDDIQDDGRASRRENASSSAPGQNDGNTVARVVRDRSSLRHRYTSFESVQQSMNAQERFIDQSQRNHSEMMYVTDRNHLEMVGIFTSTLRAVADVAREYVSKL